MCVYVARKKTAVILLLDRARHFRYKHVEIRPLTERKFPAYKVSHLCGVTFIF